MRLLRRTAELSGKSNAMLQLDGSGLHKHARYGATEGQSIDAQVPCRLDRGHGVCTDSGVVKRYVGAFREWPPLANAQGYSVHDNIFLRSNDQVACGRFEGHSLGESHLAGSWPLIWLHSRLLAPSEITFEAQFLGGAQEGECSALPVRSIRGERACALAETIGFLPLAKTASPVTSWSVSVLQSDEISKVERIRENLRRIQKGKMPRRRPRQLVVGKK